ncbi:hypothetical protein SAV31267_018990 [Streptomyces avermitilis]|uniref:Uncharacterized protein n=1 Tax=Streptomyces avermitilis TaxID=33903 RepID=A0A4D4ML31_STRAX|nr:hypothetical protein SAV31267_018990 [Streptomyces avermitilis]
MRDAVLRAERGDRVGVDVDRGDDLRLALLGERGERGQMAAAPMAPVPMRAALIRRPASGAAGRFGYGVGFGLESGGEEGSGLVASRAVGVDVS